MRGAILGTVFVVVLGASAAPAADVASLPSPRPRATYAASIGTEAWSDGRLFHVRYASMPAPVPLLTIHAWTLTVTDAAEEPVEHATLTVLGGMPAHAHGLPTVPVVTELGGGRYRVDGLKFHMPGGWIVAVRIKTATAADAVRFALELP